MKNFKRLVGLLLCLAMVLSVMPASIISAAESTGITAQNIVKSDILEEINLSGCVVGACSKGTTDNSDYSNLTWYNVTEAEEGRSWTKHLQLVDGSTTSDCTFNVGDGERGDFYVDLSNGDDGHTAIDKLELYYGAGHADATLPSVTITLLLADGTKVEETFATGWSGTTTADPLEWTFDQTYEVKGVYVCASNKTGTKVSFGEIKLYQYLEVNYLETANLNGVDLSQYKIVYSDSDLDYAYTAAEYIQKQILLRTGRQVEIVEDNTAETTYEILVGNTNRLYSKSISAPSETAMKFTFASNGTKIALKADYFIIAGAAYYFVDQYIGTSDFNVTANTGVTTQNTITKPAKNYIFMIGDGMGEMHTRLFEIYDVPTSGTYDYSDGEDIFYGYYLPYFGWQKTANIGGTITDSAAAGTALSCGYKTINGYVGKDRYLNNVKSMSELAMEIGKSVAVMSTEGCDGATPAAYSAHSEGRYDSDVEESQKSFAGLLVDGYNNYNTFTAAEYEEWENCVRAGLSAVKDDPDGFFIMYEEAHIDKVSHRLNYTSAAGYKGDTSRETLFRTVYRFNQAIGLFMEYALYNPETMLLITADHETSGLDANFLPTEQNPENEQESGSVWNHSLKDVPVFSYGQGAEVFDGVTAENASYARTWANLMTDGNADDFGDPQYPIIGSGESGEEDEGQNFYTDLPEDATKADVSTPTFGYYEGDTTGNITSYYQSAYAPGNLIDGSNNTLAYSKYYTYTEIADGTKIPVIMFEFNEAVNIAGIKLTGYDYGRYNLEDFDIEVYSHDGYSTSWYTAATVRNAFTDGTYDDPVETPLEIGFKQIREATKLRIIVKGITDMSNAGDGTAGDEELLTGSYMRIREIEVYETEYATVTPQPTTQPTEEPTQAPTEAPTQEPTQAPTQPDIPDDVVLEAVDTDKVVNPQFGYHTGLNGSFTSNYLDGYEPGNMFDGDADSNTRSPMYQFSDLAGTMENQNLVPAIYLDLTEATVLAGIEITGWQLRKYNMEDFTIQVSTTKSTDTWVTVANVTDAFTEGNRGDAITPLMVEFAPVTAYKVRILVDELFIPTLDDLAGEDDADRAELQLSSYLRVREITLYADASREPVKEQLSTPTGLTATTVGKDSFTVTADTIANGTLQFSIDGINWQTNGTFTGLESNTPYTVMAKYVCDENDYAESETVSIQITTGKIPLTNPTGLKVTATTDSSITVTADASANGTLMFRLSGGEWQESGVFTGLDRNTTYTVEAKYVGTGDYSDSGVTTTQATTKKTQLSAPTGLISTEVTDTTITVTANTTAGGTLMYRINNGQWQTSNKFTGLKSNTTYTVEAMYVAADGYIDSAAAALSVATEKGVPGTNGDYAYLEAIRESDITEHVGYNNYPNHEMYAENTVTGNYINDAMYGTAAQIRGDKVTVTREDLTGYKRLSVVFDLNNGETKVGGVELTGKAGFNITKFLIQVKNGTGAWQTVKIITSNPFTANGGTGNETVLFTFAPAAATKVRIMIEDYEENANNAPEICEMVVYEVKEDAQLSQVVVDSSSAPAVIDGNKATSYTGNAVTMSFNEATSVKRLILFGSTNETSIGAYTVEVQTTQGGAWTKVTDGNAYSVTRAFNTSIVNLDKEYMVYGVRVTSDGTFTIPEIELNGYLTAPTPADPNPATTPGAVAPTEATRPPVAPPAATQAPTQPFTVPTGDIGMVEPTAPVATQPATQKPTYPVVQGQLKQLTGFSTPTFGYYSNNNTNGSITDYYIESPANMTDGNTGNRAQSDYYTHAEIASGAKIPVILFNFGSEVTLGAIEIHGYETSRYNMEDFEIQVYTSEGWETAASVTDAFYDENTYGEDLDGPLMVTFDRLFVGTQLRILVSGISDMTQDAEEDPDPDSDKFYTGAHIRIPEIKLYHDPNGIPEGSTGGTPSWQPIDLTGTVVGACSYGTTDSSNYSNLSWYSTYRPTWDKPWKTAMVDGYPSTKLEFSVSATDGKTERADIYFDLSKGAGGYTAINRFVLTHSGEYAVPEVTIILLLKDGTQKKFVYSPNWTKGGSGELDETFDQTYNVIGVYIWESQNLSGSSNDHAAFGEFELYKDTSNSNGLGTTTVGSAGYVEVPLNSSNLVGACSGSYAARDISTSTNFGAISWYFKSSSGFNRITGLVDGTTNPSSSSQYSEWGMDPNEGGDFYLKMSSATAIDQIRLYSYKHSTSYANPEKIRVFLVLGSGSVVEKSFTTGWTSSTPTGTPCELDLGQTYTVTGVYVLSTTNTPAYENKGKISLAEVELYRKKDVQLNAPANLQATATTENSITVAANTLSPAAAGTLKFRINGGAWQTSGTFSGLTAGTSYTIDAMYDAATGYIDSGISTITVKTATPIITEFTVSGTVTGSTNDTVTVRLYKNGAVVRETTANANGEYSFSNVPIGNYSVTALKGNHIAKSATITVSTANVTQNFTLEYVAPVTSEVFTDAVVLANYNVHLVEPWALRVNVTFYTEKNGTPIDLSTFKSYGAYAIIAGEYGDGIPATWEDIVNNPNASQFKMADGAGDYNMYATSATTAVFDFYDGLYTYRLAENVYWVAYYEDADGNIHFSSVLKPVVTQKIDEIINNSRSDTEKVVLNTMKGLHSALIAFRGVDAELGKDYTNDEGALNYNQGLKAPTANSTYQYGKTHRIRLIEPWGLMVSIQIRDKSTSTMVDFNTAANYGMIFFHDKKGEYNGDMLAEQILARNDVYVYSKELGNVNVEDGKMIAIYAKDIYTSELDSDVFCLPFVVDANGNYHYAKSAFCMNLIDEMYAFHNRAGLKNEERATFRKMIELYESTIVHFGKTYTKN